MAQMLHSTRFTSPTTAASSFNVTVPATAAGATLVVVAGGGATIQAKLGVGGTNFTKRTSSLNAREVVAQDIVDSGGGTTTIEIALNGPENVDGMIFEFASGALGNFIAGAVQSASSPTSAGSIATNTVTTSGASVLFSMFTTNGGSGAIEQLWGLEPLGKQFENEYVTPDASKSKYRSMIGVSDQLSAGTFAAKSSVTGGITHQSVVWAYENLDSGTPSYTNPYTNAIAEENSLPGDLKSSWIGGSTNASICGFTDSMSYTPGSTVNFKIDSANSAFTVSIYRLGFYGYATFGAKFKASVTGSPAAQSSPSVNSYGGTECAWSTTATWAIPSTAVPGVYMYAMNRSGQVAQGLFVVRSTPPGSQTDAIMVTTADYTWQGYNVWGATSDVGTSSSGYSGRSLFLQAPSGGLTSRAFAVSYERPFGTVGSNSFMYFWDSEFALVNFLEGNGYPLAYYSMVDIEKDTTIPAKYKIAAINGQAEFWTTNLRDAFENARDAGTNLFFASSQTSLWRARFDSGDTNKRNLICYKDSHDTVGYDGTTKYDPVSYTGTWRDNRTVGGGVNNTVRRPEPGLSGQWAEVNGVFEERYGFPASYGSLPIWRNTSVAASPSITVRGTGSTSLTSAATTLNISQPSGTVVGDLLVLAVTFNNTTDIDLSLISPFRLVRQVTSTGGGAETSAIFVGYALASGSGTLSIAWTGSRTAAATLVCYGNAVWEDVDTSIISDTGGTAAHTTRSVSNDGTGRWAVCVFGDNDATGSSKTTSWTAGSGLTSRVQADSSAAASGPWSSSAIMDTNGAVSQGTHQYTATAEFANAQGFAGILYLSPGVSGIRRSVGSGWDYLKAEEPSTSTNLVRLSRQVLPVIDQVSTYNGATYLERGTLYHGLTLYRASSGALVFNSGSRRWNFGLSRFRLATFDDTGDIDIVMQQATVNMIRDMGIAPNTLLGTTANNNATALVDPGSAASPSSYGFPVSVTTYQTIMSATPPTNYNANDNTSYTLGTIFTASVAGDVYGIRWHFPGTLPDASVIGVLYSWTDDSSGTELAQVNFKNVQTGWNSVLFSSPVAIAANTRYVAAVWTEGRYVSVSGQFASGAVTNGSLTAPQDNFTAHNGKFVSASTPTYPNATFGSNGYLADVLFISSAGATFEGWGFPI